MKLPDVDKAQVPESKITQYLLSTTHRSGKSKAFFFLTFGFDPDHWEDLASALKQHARDNEVAVEEVTVLEHVM